MRNKIVGSSLIIILVRILLINFNIAEWGDSYNFIRAAEFLTRFDYPLDEKRLPLFPLLISFGLKNFEAVLFARLLLFVFTLGCLILTYKLYKVLFPQIKNHYYTYLILFLSPVFLYWSLRVMAEVVFTFWVLLSFYYFYSTKESVRKLFLLGILVGLTALTRFEGYFLFLSFLIYLASKNLRNPKGLLFKISIFTVSFVLIQTPWLVRKYLVFGNVFASSYFSEPETFEYSLKMLLTYFASFLFLFGITSALYFIYRGTYLFWKKEKFSIFEPIIIFVILDLILTLLWPAAIPRLFFPILPILSIFFVTGLEFIKEENKKEVFTISFILLILYAILQYKMHLYFLVVSKSGFVLILLLSLLSASVWLMPNIERVKRYYLVFALLSSTVATGIILMDHRNIYATVYKAAIQAREFEGPVAYFDETGVSRWYLRNNGLYYPRSLGDQRQWDWLLENKVKYILWTDEHNEGSALNIVKEAQFNDNFLLVNRYSQEMVDYFDLLLIKAAILPEKEYPKRHSELYKVVN